MKTAVSPHPYCSIPRLRQRLPAAATVGEAGRQVGVAMRAVLRGAVGTRAVVRSGLDRARAQAGVVDGTLFYEGAHALLGLGRA